MIVHEITEWGVRYPDGKIFSIDAAAAAEAYHSPESLARHLETLGNLDRKAVRRTRTVTLTDWEPA